MRLLALSLFSLSLFASVSASAGTPNEDTFSGDYLASRTASRLMDLSATEQFTSAALKQDPGNGILLERLFVVKVMQGDIASAEPLAAQVVKTNSQQRTARLVLGLKNFKAKRYADARENFNEAAYTPFGTLTSVLLNAWSYAGENQLNAALRELDKLDTQDAFAGSKAFHAALICDLLNSGMRAESFYKKAIALSPNALRVTLAYGNFLERQARKDDASAVYKKYLEGGQGNAFVQKALDNLASGTKPGLFVPSVSAGAGEVLYSISASLTGDQTSDAALIYSQLALSVAADKPFVLTTLGGILGDMKLYERSNAAFDLVPKDSLLRSNAETEMALNLHRLEKSDDAITKLKAVVAADPKDDAAWITLAGIYRATDKHELAAEAYSQAITLLPEDAPNLWRIYYNRGIDYDRLKQYDKAEVDFRKALKLSNDDASVLNYLGYSMIDRGVNLDEAIAMVKKAVSLKPNDGYITDSLGWAYYVLRDYDQAVTYCERAVDLIPSDAIIADHLGDVYWKVGRKLEAKFQWQHALDNHPDDVEIPRIQAKLKDGLPDADPAKPAVNATPDTKPTNG
ncbi:tetratricopeptide repeat protein [Aestuariivirga litoralis]|uniref:tetratricopeptide repeat protein n=1 Tax=Aestuariivirga litoralis TaxID=2650924 RepID=UPI0018C7A7A4|nr:tetratricopeptide repeat protein [Aestuariivirga litoralis]MBG1233099.1 tetratricopeptide repeat protein [Aestuariivirga litoralis]